MIKAYKNCLHYLKVNDQILIKRLKRRSEPDGSQKVF